MGVIKSCIKYRNNDTIIRSRASIETLVEFLESHPACGVAQGTMKLPQDGGLLSGCGSFLTPFGFLCSPGFGVPDAPEFHVPTPCFSAIGAFMIFRRSLLPATGGFLFRSHFWSYYEETDFCHRAGNAGWETWFVPTPPIDHLCGATSCRFDNKFVWRRYFRNILYSFWRNFGLFGCFFTLPCFVCAAFIRSPSALCGAVSDLIRNQTPPLRSSRS